MRRALAGSLLLGALPILQGCCVIGTVSRWDGLGPIAKEDRTLHYREVASGDGGTLLVRQGTATELLAVTPGGIEARTLGGAVSFAGAHVANGKLYRVTSEGVAVSPLDDPEHAETVAHVVSARAVSVAGETVLVAQPDAVVLIRGASTRTIWQGEALAIALDVGRHAAWIAALEPLPAIDLVDVEQGTILLRLPLPEELASPNLRFVLSDEAVAVYAHDRPLEAALVLLPDQGKAWRFRFDGSVAAAGELDRAACPPLLVVPSESVPPGSAPPASVRAESAPPLSVPAESPATEIVFPPSSPGTVPGPSSRRSFGRVAPLAGNRFVVARASEDRSSISIDVLAIAPTGLSLRHVTTPAPWRPVVAGVGWTREHVYVAVDQVQTLRVDADLGCELESAGPGADAVHALNYLVNAPIVVAETAVSVGVGVPVGCLAVPFSPFLFLLRPEIGLAALVAPIWAPFVRT